MNFKGHEYATELTWSEDIWAYGRVWIAWLDDVIFARIIKQNNRPVPFTFFIYNSSFKIAHRGKHSDMMGARIEVECIFNAGEYD